MRHRSLIVLALILAACAGQSAPNTTSAPLPADGPTLNIEGRAFGRVPELAPGDSMTIVNNDSVRHTFTSGNDSWESVDIAGDTSATFTVPADLAPGRYVFFCQVHADMGGTLTVSG